MAKLKLIFSILITVFTNELYAQQAGDLDITFNSDGKVITDFGLGNDYCGSIVIQIDGKIVAAGGSNNGTNSDFGLVRYNIDGSLDSSFGIGGILTTDISTNKIDIAHAIALQSDGKIIVAGRAYIIDFDFALARYNTDGKLDSSFSGDGILTTAIGTFHDIVNSIAIQANGKIIATGYSFNGSDYDFAVTRYNEDGTLDSSFSSDGMLVTPFGLLNDEAFGVAIQQDQKIVVAGWMDNSTDYDFALARYNTDGSLDTSFGIGGKVITYIGTSIDQGLALTIQPDGKIVAAGNSNINSVYKFALVRYNTDGVLDSSFSQDGKLTTDFGTTGASWRSVVIQADGKIVTGGYSNNGNDSDFCLARYISGLITGTINFSLNNTILIYPNPIQNYEVIEYSLIKDELISIYLYDISGKLMKQIITNEYRPHGAHKELLDFGSDLLAGNYILSISNSHGSTFIKLIKQ